jgi:Cdc6-like AAA superfamily ATPase
MPRLVKGLDDSTAPETCSWIFEETAFQRWIKAPENPLLWIYGPSGVGKSHLAAKLVKFFKPSHLSGDNTGTKANIATYFVPYPGIEGDKVTNPPDEISTESAVKLVSNDVPPSSGDDLSLLQVSDLKLDDPQKSSPGMVQNIIRTLCWQLCEDDKDYLRDLTDHFEAIQSKAGETNTLISTWKSLFERKILQDRFVTFVIDGINNINAKERERLLYLLRRIAQVSSPKFGPTYKSALM